MPPTPHAKVSVSAEVTDFVSSVKPSVIKEKERRLSGAREPARNLQYKMATDRLKKEILEVKLREDELKARGRAVSTSSAAVVRPHITTLHTYNI